MQTRELFTWFCVAALACATLCFAAYSTEQTKRHRMNVMKELAVAGKCRDAVNFGVGE